MADKSNRERDNILRRMLKTTIAPKPAGKREKAGEADPMPTDDPAALVEWGNGNIQVKND